MRSKLSLIVSNFSPVAQQNNAAFFNRKSNVYAYTNAAILLLQSSCFGLEHMQKWLVDCVKFVQFTTSDLFCQIPAYLVVIN